MNAMNLIRRKGTLRLPKLKRKPSLPSAMTLHRQEGKEPKEQQQQKPPMQIGSVIEGSFQHHAHVPHTQSSGDEPETIDEVMLKSINTALEAVRPTTHGSWCLIHAVDLTSIAVSADGSRWTHAGGSQADPLQRDSIAG